MVVNISPVLNWMSPTGCYNCPQCAKEKEIHAATMRAATMRAATNIFVNIFVGDILIAGLFLMFLNITAHVEGVTSTTLYQLL